MEDQPAKRLTELKTDAQEQIDQGKNKIQEAENKLSQGAKDLANGQESITTAEGQLANGQREITSGKQQLNEAQGQLASGQARLSDSLAQLIQAEQLLSDGKNELANKEGQLASAGDQLNQAKQQLDTGQAQLDAAANEIASKESQLQASQTQLDQSKAQLDAARAQLDAMANQLQAKGAQLEEARAALATITDPSQRTAQEAALQQEEATLAQAQSQLQSQEGQYQAGLSEYNSKAAQLQAASAQLSAAKGQLAQKQAEFTSKSAEYQAGLAQYKEGVATYNSKVADFQNGQAKLSQAEQTLAEKEAQLATAKKTLAEKQKEYDEAKAKADPELAEKRQELKEAQEKVDQLSTPTYQVYTRREVPGSEGYISYENNASIISNVGNIFPVVLYFIAALVTFVTMGRFVEEERIKAGTFKALGYQNKDIIRKFVTYGLVTSLVGTAVGVVAGHLLLPSIIYNTYKAKLLVAPLELHFYPVKTLLAILLALISAVLPAYLVASRELGEKPAQLLLPKPPTSGSKILLERITPLWKRMSFTQKVTARNIFRYKQRMFMTIFGVCGSIALLFAGLGIRSSIADLNNRQFEDIIRYDMIVANQDNLTSDQTKSLDQLLNSDQVKEQLPVHYETLTKEAGSNKDNQSITTLVIKDQDQKSFNQYIQLKDRETGKKLEIPKNGIIISEKMANLAGIKAGDQLTVQDSQDKDITFTVAGVTEMYMSHFIFMNESTYEEAFGKVATDNANMITLNNRSNQNVEKVATQFMDLEGVRGVVQNITLKSQVETIVNSLNRVMGVLIAVSVLLAIVVLFNLTNINVAERIRELSTIKVLGFYNKEVTLYIYRETIYLSLIGILVGFGLGLGLHSYMVGIIPPDTVMFNPAVGWLIYAVPTAVVVIILTGLGFFVNKRLKHVNMLEALKSVE